MKMCWAEPEDCPSSLWGVDPGRGGQSPGLGDVQQASVGERGSWERGSGKRSYQGSEGTSFCWFEHRS